MKSRMPWEADPYLEPYKKDIIRRYQKAFTKAQEISGYGNTLDSAINSHLYYGVHKTTDSWIFREWAPNATAIYIIGDVNSWTKDEEYSMKRLSFGNWELILPLEKFSNGDLFKWLICWNGGEGERVPAYATRCVQDPHTKLFAAQIWDSKEYVWQNDRTLKITNPLIYEAHIGMSGEEESVYTYTGFRENVLPRIVKLGYNTIQLMALQEHPYYGSFGYQVSSFFAASSRFGTPEELKMLIDEAHSYNIAVIMDLVHSHAVKNSNEGLSLFDGTSTQYFHQGERGDHPAWTSKCFNYGKREVLNFLLSNCKYWMEEYHLDGFRFDGITSMIYLDHGLGKNFTDYSCYFDGNQDEDAITYLYLANKLIKEINPNATTVAEDVSGMPGLAAKGDYGSVGFDFRLSMGIADNWIKWIKELRDEQWNMGEIFAELTSKRSDERTVSYAECHDQAMVGDKTIIFRLMDKEMYTSMSKNIQSLVVDRGMALHKMIRLITIATAGDGYLNFMGNEFGHPEWIDFPREGNKWSFLYARRQWSLADNTELKYKFLMDFDAAMINMAKRDKIFGLHPHALCIDDKNQVLVFSRGDNIFAFNFNPNESFADYMFQAPAGKYKVVLDTDSLLFGGFGRIMQKTEHFTQPSNDENLLSVYIPCRTAFVLKKAR